MTYAIVAAGGKGERMGISSGKQLHSIGGKPMLLHSLEVFEKLEYIDGTIIAADGSLMMDLEAIVKDEGLVKVEAVVKGGRERIDSVANALKAVPTGARFIAVHDGARPMIDADLVDRLYEFIIKGDFDGVIPAVPLKDTVKRVNDDEVVETLLRPELVSVQTPQFFVAERLRGAYRRLSASQKELSNLTDDASIVERAGGKVGVVDGDEMNIKVTTPFDLRVAEMILGVER